MIAPSQHSPERLAYAGLVVLTLSPVALQAFWGPLAGLLNVEADSLGLACSALGVACAALAATTLHRVPRGAHPAGGWIPAACAGGAALLLGVLLARSGLALVATVASLLWVAVFSAALLPRIIAALPPELDGLCRRHKVVATLMAVLSLATVTLTTRLSAFMGDSSRAELSLLPSAPFLVHHSCLTAYVEGMHLADARVENLYDVARWPDLNGTPRAEAEHGAYAPFGLDAFAYPPPFLLLPRALLGWLPNFGSQRAFWFALNGLFMAAGLWVVAQWTGGPARVRALLMAPVVWVSMPTLATLQVGNVHLAVVVLAMLALLAFERHRPALGGALLAFATLSKVSPGLLILVLLVRRRFREVLWTCAFGVGFAALGLLVFGPAPFVQFVSYELPRLASGEALSFLAGPESVAINLSPFGLPFKLAALGLPIADPWAVARGLHSVYTVLLVVLAVIGARTDRGPRATAQLWTALLLLTSLRSPLAPGYVTFALLWTLSLRAVDVRGSLQAAGLAAVWLLVVVIPPPDSAAMVPYMLIQQGVVLAMGVYCALWPSGASRAEHIALAPATA